MLTKPNLVLTVKDAEVTVTTTISPREKLSSKTSNRHSLSGHYRLMKCMHPWGNFN